MMTDEQIEAEVARVAKMTRELLKNLPDDEDKLDFRIGQFGIVAIGEWNYEDGGTGEWPLFRFETPRYHVQVGILKCAMASLEQRLIEGRG